jgi:Short C-terminal domain
VQQQQQQGGGYGSVSFTAAAPAPQHQSHPTPQFAPQTHAPELAFGASGDPEAIVAVIESLAGLHQRGILSDEEFAAKKAELLGRL